jgi:hypothetical protein
MIIILLKKFLNKDIKLYSGGTLVGSRAQT